MEQRVISRHKVVLLILFTYFLPVLGLSFLHADPTASWSLLGFGLFISVSGSLLFFWLLLSWEEKMALSLVSNVSEELPVEAEPKPIVLPIDNQKLEELEKSVQEQQVSLGELEKQLQEKQAELIELKESQEKQIRMAAEEHEALQKDFSLQRQHLLDDLDKQRQLIVEHYQTILEQRDNLDRKTQQMAQLESKVRDLNYELKTILHLTEKTIPMQELVLPKVPARAKPEEFRPVIDTTVQTEEGAAMQLKRCLEIAQGITGASHSGTNSRFREFSPGHYALDQRRLFDRLRTEEASTIFVYSPNDNKMLFVNDQVKLLLGITTDRFIQGFSEIAASGLQNWEKALQQLSFRSEVQLQLILKTRFGEEVLFECLLGMIPTGLFRNQVIGILFESHHLQARSKSV